MLRRCSKATPVISRSWLPTSSIRTSLNDVCCGPQPCRERAELRSLSTDLSGSPSFDATFQQGTSTDDIWSYPSGELQANSTRSSFSISLKLVGDCCAEATT